MLVVTKDHCWIHYFTRGLQNNGSPMLSFVFIYYLNQFQKEKLSLKNNPQASQSCERSPLPPHLGGQEDCIL